MKSEWQYLSLRDCITHKKGFAFKSSDYTNFGTPIVKVTNTTDNGIDMTSVVYISDELAEKNKSVELLKNDIVIATVGSWPTNPASVVGKTIKVPTDAEGALLNQNAVRIRPLTDSIDKLFLYYLLKNKSFSDYLVGNAQGSANQASITLEDIYSYETNIPPLPTQKKIAHILSTLDDKIELNRKMNQTLEEMASAIFKSWFVDFDPVHAKANCEDEAELENIAKELGVSKEILDLFPSEFIESELGMIPKGWEWKSFGDVVVPKRGKTITKSTITEGNIPVVAGGLSPAYYHGEYNAEAPTITISASGANAGYVNLYNENIWASDCSYINNTNTKYVYSMYLFLKEQQYEITRMQQGAAQPHVYPKDLMRLMIVECGEKFWKLLEKTITPIFEKIANNQNEIQTLEKTRDTLLPKLLSGEVEV